MRATQSDREGYSGDPRCATRWFAGARIIYAGMLAATWGPQRGRGDVNLVPFVSHIKEIVAWGQGKRSPSLEVALVVRGPRGKRAALHATDRRAGARVPTGAGWGRSRAPRSCWVVWAAS